MKKMNKVNKFNIGDRVIITDIGSGDAFRYDKEHLVGKLYLISSSRDFRHNSGGYYYGCFRLLEDDSEIKEIFKKLHHRNDRVGKKSLVFANVKLAHSEGNDKRIDRSQLNSLSRG